MPLPSGLRGWGTPPGSPAGFLGASGRGRCPLLPSCSSCPGGPLLPASPGLPGLPPMPPGHMQPGGGFGGRGTSLGAQQAPPQPPNLGGANAPVGGANALCSFPPPLVLEGPSHLPPLFSPGLPPTPPGPTWPGEDV